MFLAVGGRIGSGTLGTLAGFVIAVWSSSRSSRHRMSGEGIDIGRTFQSIPPI
jgi:hypothetical protein